VLRDEVETGAWDLGDQAANAMGAALDVTFREDDCRVRKDHAARKLSAIRKFALSAFRPETLHPDRSLGRRRKLADRRPDYRVELLGRKSLR